MLRSCKTCDSTTCKESCTLRSSLSVSSFLERTVGRAKQVFASRRVISAYPRLLCYRLAPLLFPPICNFSFTVYRDLMAGPACLVLYASNTSTMRRNAMQLRDDKPSEELSHIKPKSLGDSIRYIEKRCDRYSAVGRDVLMYGFRYARDGVIAPARGHIRFLAMI
jgi:hypothetical protein